MLGATETQNSSDRKSAWKDIQYRLEYGGFHKKSELKLFEAYFMKGVEPKLHPLDEDPIPLVYRLWFAADQSAESWQAITRRLLAGPHAWTSKVSIEPNAECPGESWRELCGESKWGWQIARSLKDSYDILTQRASASYFDGVTPAFGHTEPAPLGFMGGIEKAIYQFMTGAGQGGEAFSYDGRPLFTPPRYFGHHYYRELCCWLDVRLPSNPFSITNFMGEHWVDSLSEEYLNKVFSDEAVMFYLDCYLKLIARYPTAGLDADRLEHATLVRELLDKRQLPASLDLLWKQAKTYQGPIDLNIYMQKSPYYLGEF